MLSTLWQLAGVHDSVLHICVYNCHIVTVADLIASCRGDRLQLQANIVVLGWTRAIPYVALKTANMQVGD